MILLRESIHSTEDHIQIPRDASRKNPGPFFGFGIQKRFFAARRTLPYPEGFWAGRFHITNART